jgi:hypothetical protein
VRCNHDREETLPLRTWPVRKQFTLAKLLDVIVNLLGLVKNTVFDVFGYSRRLEAKHRLA